MDPIQTEIKYAIEVLSKGGLILFPTDTIWGIGCDATNEEAVKKIYKLKRREESKSMIVLLDNPNMLPSYIHHVPEQAYLLIEYSEKPLSIIYDGAKNLAKSVIAPDGSIAIRITKDPFCSGLISRFRKPIVATSANISNEKTPACFKEVNDSIRNGVDYIVNLRQNELSINKPSTIIQIKENGQIRFIRK